MKLMCWSFYGSHRKSFVFSSDAKIVPSHIYNHIGLLKWFCMFVCFQLWNLCPLFVCSSCHSVWPLGAGPDGVEEIKRHRFFASIDWNVSASYCEHSALHIRLSHILSCNICMKHIVSIRYFSLFIPWRHKLHVASDGYSIQRKKKKDDDYMPSLRSTKENTNWDIWVVAKHQA